MEKKTYKDKSIAELHQALQKTKLRISQADEHIKKLGEPQEKIGLSINGATLEIQALLKDLFLCSQHDLAEYELIQAELLKQLNNIAHIANTNFGRKFPKHPAAPNEVH